MFVPIRFKTSMQLGPHELFGKDIDTILLNKLRVSLEGVCSRFGYIKPKSIEVIRRSAGTFIKHHFNGYLRYEFICKAEVCNPPVGMVLEAVVKNKNALGILAESSIIIDNSTYQIIDIIIPRKSAGITSQIDLNILNINDKINVEVVNRRFQLKDSKISVIGKAIPQEQLTVQEDITDFQVQEAEDDLDDDEHEDLENDAEVDGEVDADAENENEPKQDLETILDYIDDGLGMSDPEEDDNSGDEYSSGSEEGEFEEYD